MKNLNAEVFSKNIKRNRILLIIGIIFLGITVLLINLGIKNENKKLPDLNEMASLIENNNYQEDIYASTLVATKPYLFAAYEENGKEENNKFYLTMDQENHLYVVYMSDDKFLELNNDTIEEKPIVIKGLTKKISEELKELVIESYNEIMEDEYLTKDNYEEYVGLIYLDNVSPINDSTLYYLGAILSGMFFLLIIITYIVIILKNKKLLKTISYGELAVIDSEISQMSNSEYSKMNFYLLKDYLVDMYGNIVIIKYSDILWIYPFEQRYNGLLINKCLKVKDKNNKLYSVSNTKLLDKQKDQILEEIIEKIKNKNNDILVGYNKETKKIVKEKIKELKDKKKN